jgi:hypothetical protein
MEPVVLHTVKVIIIIISIMAIEESSELRGFARSLVDIVSIVIGVSRTISF